ncbi:MAG: AAA family ATPase, partial [Acidimicrobiales bacterium]
MVGWPLVGRDEELALLDDAVVARGGSVVVAGGVGVGKSRLVGDFLGRLDGLRVRTVQVRATRSTATIPFGPFAAWAPASGSDRLQMLRGIGAALEAEAEADAGSMVVAVDDAHMLDAGSAALVLHLVEHGRVRVICTVRDGERCPDAVVALWREGLAERVTLQPLSEPEVGDLVDQVLDGLVDAAAYAWLWALTRGTPLYLYEVVRAALAQGILAEVDGSWRWQGALRGSAELNGLIGQHLADAEPDERRLVEQLAFGEPLPVDLVVRLGATEALASAEQHGFVVVETAPPGPAVRLAHPLYGEVLRAAVPLMTARSHRRHLAAAAKECGWGERDPVRVASWWLESGTDDGDAQILLAGANRAFLLADWELSERLAHAAERAGGGEGAVLARAAALVPLQRLDEADRMLAELAAATGDDATASLASVWRADLLFSWLGDESGALAVLEDAVQRLPAPFRAQVLAFAGSLAVLALDPVRAVRLATEATAEAGPAVEVRVQALSVATLGWMVQGQTEAAVQFAELALPHAPADPVDGTKLAADLPWAYALALSFDGRLEDAAAAADDLLQLSRREGFKFFQGRAATMVGALAVTQGKLGLALRSGREAQTVMGERELSPHWPAATVATAAAQLGDVDTAWAALRHVEGGRPAAHMFRLQLGLARAWCTAAAGEVSAAQSIAGEMAADAADAGAWSFEMFALLDVVRFGAASSVCERLDELRHVVQGGFPPVIADFAAAAAARDGPALDAVSGRFEQLGAMLLAAEASAYAATAHA